MELNLITNIFGKINYPLRTKLAGIRNLSRNSYFCIMFTGIIEELGTVKALERDKGNLIITIKSKLARRLKLNDSVAHNGVCLSVTPLSKKLYQVTAVKETLNRTNLKNLKMGDKVNLERALKAEARFNGHFVLGHIDSTAECLSAKKLRGSYIFNFSCRPDDRRYLVQKGSIAINGVSLTIAGIDKSGFSTAIIPYTFENTVFRYMKSGDKANMEFDVLGKYALNSLEGNASLIKRRNTANR